MAPRRLSDLNLDTVGDPQLYPYCAVVSVSGGGSATPSSSDLTTFPAAYSINDAFRTYDVYNPQSDYVNYGPAVWSGSSGSSSGGGSSTAPTQSAGNTTQPSASASQAEPIPSNGSGSGYGTGSDSGSSSGAGGSTEYPTAEVPAPTGGSTIESSGGMSAPSEGSGSSELPEEPVISAPPAEPTYGGETS